MFYRSLLLGFALFFNYLILPASAADCEENFYAQINGRYLVTKDNLFKPENPYQLSIRIAKETPDTDTYTLNFNLHATNKDGEEIDSYEIAKFPIDGQEYSINTELHEYLADVDNADEPTDKLSWSAEYSEESNSLKIQVFGYFQGRYQAQLGEFDLSVKDLDTLVLKINAHIEEKIEAKRVVTAETELKLEYLLGEFEIESCKDNLEGIAPEALMSLMAADGKDLYMYFLTKRGQKIFNIPEILTPETKTKKKADSKNFTTSTETWKKRFKQNRFQMSYKYKELFPFPFPFPDFVFREKLNITALGPNRFSVSYKKGLRFFMRSRFDCIMKKKI